MQSRSVNNDKLDYCAGQVGLWTVQYKDEDEGVLLYRCVRYADVSAQLLYANVNPYAYSNQKVWYPYRVHSV